MDVKVCESGTSMGTSSRFPSSGRPLGPGGYGSVVPLRPHFQINAREAAIHNDAT